MIRQIENIRKTRFFLLERLKYLSTDEFNRTPNEFNNNIIWNLGHIIAVQQGICYKKAAAVPLINDEFWEKYKPGSVPQTPVKAIDVENIKRLFLSSINQLEIDCNTTVFGNYTPWTTAYGLEIRNIKDAINFETFHEGLHFGTIVALIKIIQS